MLIQGRAMAQGVSRRSLTTEAQVRARLVNLGFVVGKVVLEQSFIRVLRFPLSISFHRGCPYSYILWGMNNRPASSRSSET
jgi:hypothetical protein